MIFLEQSRKYAKYGVGLGGAVLKHSLYPLNYLKETLPHRGLILDLGCGEGMLTNLLAGALPAVKFQAIDLDREKVELAQKVANDKTEFKAGDIFKADYRDASAVIFNDVLHHHDDEHKLKLLRLAHDFLDDQGLIVLKEVNKEDRRDVRWTKFWDQKLYPQDQLNFCTVSEWKSLLQQAGFRLLDVKKVHHPWIASRTLIVATKRAKLDQLDFSKLKQVDDKAIKVLLTGATGFIGENMARELLFYGIEGAGVNLALLTRNKENVPSYLRSLPNVTVIEKDLNALTEGELGYFDYVFHMASRVEFFGGKQVYEDNVNATKSLLKAVSRSGLKRFVYTSTMGALDRSKNDKCQHLLDEDSPAHPVSYYGKSKLEDERLLQESGLPYTIIRVPWCYGPGMSTTHHVRVLFEKVLKGGLPFKFKFPGRVSIISVGSLVRVLAQVAADSRTEKETYFASDGEPISFGELFSKMGETFGKRVATIKLPKLLFVLIRLFRFMVPFQIKSLCMDVLAVSNQKLQALGYEFEKRPDDFLLALANYISRERHPSRFRSEVLVTGSASGIGEALSKQFYALDYSLWLVDRNEEDLRHLSSKLGSEYSVVDLAHENQLAELCQEVLQHQKLQILVNNAGIGMRGALVDSHEDKLSTMFKVNCLAAVFLSRAALKQFLELGDGTLINVISSSAFQPLPYMSAYAASKAAMLSFSEGITGELLSHEKVEVLTVSPSGTATAFQQTAGVKDNGDKLLTASQVAGQMIGMIGRGSSSEIVGRSGKMMSLLARLLPRKKQIKLWEKLMTKMR